MTEEKAKRSVRKIPEDAIVTVVEGHKAVRPSSKRAAYLEILAESDTVGEYFSKVEDKGEARSFLVWYIDNGFVTLG